MAKGYIAKIGFVGLGASAACLLALWATNPAAIGPIGVTIWFIALAVALSCWFGLGWYAVGSRLWGGRPAAPQQSDAWRRGLFAGGYVTILIALSSLRQLNLRDAILLLALLVLVEFYLVAKS